MADGVVFVYGEGPPFGFPFQCGLGATEVPQNCLPLKATHFEVHMVKQLGVNINYTVRQ